MSLKIALSLAALPLLVSAAKSSRTFAVMHFQGDGPLVESRMDPIVDPGTAAGHVHTVMGGNGFGISMNDTSALDSTCTNTYLNHDSSNYWTPKLYFQSPTNGSFTAVDMFYMNVYYFFEPTDDDIKAFPEGMRMLSGDPFLRSPPSTGGKSILDLAEGPIQPVQFTCPRTSTSAPLYPVNSNGLTGGVGIQDPQNTGAGAGFPDQNCDGEGSPLRADIHFPSCYNPAAGPDNYKNNTAFPSSQGATGGRQNCPPGWIHTPHIFYEVYWNTPVFAKDWTPGQGKQPFVLAQGDPTGYGLHGDFISGWDVSTLQTIIDTCDAGDSGMDKCPQIPGGLSTSKNCNVTPPSSLASEIVIGNMKALPGCNPIQAGPGPASPNPPGCPAVAGSGPAPSSPALSVPAPSVPAPSAPAPSAPAPSIPTSSVHIPSGHAPSSHAPPGPAPSGHAPSASSSAANDSTMQPAPSATGSESVYYTTVGYTTMAYTTVQAASVSTTLQAGDNHRHRHQSGHTSSAVATTSADDCESTAADIEKRYATAV